MGLLQGLQIISLIVCIAASYPDGGLAAVFNVTGFGAIGDGIHDDTEVVIKTSFLFPFFVSLVFSKVYTITI